MKKIEPIGGNILIKRIEQTTKGGIIIPETAKEKPKQGEVIAVGTGAVDEDGNKKPFNVKKGDKVIFESYAGSDIILEGEEYLIMSEESILGILKS